MAKAADWPQWRGPNRDGKSPDADLLQEWPEAGPELLWQVNDLGQGYGSPSVAAGRIFIVVNRGLDNESVTALSEADGSQLWSTQIGKVGNPNQRPNYPAARSTPTVVGDSVYVLGSDGDLACLAAASGEIRWKRNVRTDFGGKPGEWAYAGSPLVDGDLLITAPGSEEAAIVAVNRHDGEVIWKAKIPGSDTAGYASVISSNVGNGRQYIAYLGMGLVGVDAESGKFLWHYGNTKGQANSSTPVASNGLVYSGSGRVGGGLVALEPKPEGVEAVERYFDPSLPNAQGGFVLLGDHLYGGGRSVMMCIDFNSGEKKWTERIPASASICSGDGQLYLHLEDGDVMLVDANPEAFRQRGKFTPPNRPEGAEGKPWAYPVIANGRLYIRESGSLWCYDIQK
ncbi:MAG: PQQ-binding-like beta-propeller repeat protein [bacterium]|nr:PQQ-binding-like beta-propeller repeat protein [bacterium]